MKLKQIIKKNFHYFFFFYSYLRHRIFIAFSLSFLKGLLDGLGLAMFIPLLKIANSSPGNSGGEELGNLSFLPIFFQEMGIELNIINVLLIILGFFILKGIISFIEGYTHVIYQQSFMREIRFSNIDLLNSFQYSSFVKLDSGRIQNTFSGEVGRVNMAYRSYFKAIEYGVLILVYIILAFSANPEFAMIVALGGILTNIVFKWLFKKTKRLSKKYTESAHSFERLLLQQVAIYKYLKATGLNRFYGNKLKGQITELEDLQKDLGIVDSLSRALREPMTILIVVFAILVQVTYSNSDIGLIILSLLFLYRALTFLMALQEHWNKFLGLSGSLDSMKEFISELQRNKERNGSIKFEFFKDFIELKNIGFKYGQSSIIENLNITIYKNETLAIVGESGSGKTTLMNILAGLLLPSAGVMKVDRVSIDKLDLYSYRNKIGYIAQEAPIFNDTIFNNITFWAEKNLDNMERFNAAIRKAAIYDFVMQLPLREEELLGNNGVNISGGQKQRLSIARELFKDVDFLFMDEATSALDAETEIAMQNNIENLKGNYTIIIIAHRLSTIKNADRIVLLNNGKITDEGNFQELLDTSEIFKNMIRLQEI